MPIYHNKTKPIEHQSSYIYVMSILHIYVINKHVCLCYDVYVCLYYLCYMLHVHVCLAQMAQIFLETSGICSKVLQPITDEFYFFFYYSGDLLTSRKYYMIFIWYSLWSIWSIHYHLILEKRPNSHLKPDITIT